MRLSLRGCVFDYSLAEGPTYIVPGDFLSFRYKPSGNQPGEFSGPTVVQPGIGKSRGRVIAIFNDTRPAVPQENVAKNNVEKLNQLIKNTNK